MTSAQERRIEVSLRKCTDEERKLFAFAKEREIHDNEAVQGCLRAGIP